MNTNYIYKFQREYEGIGYGTAVNVSVRFPKDNEIFFGMDMQFYKGIPDDIDFYPEKCTGDKIVFYGEGYGSRNNYGSGAIYVSYTALPEYIKEVVRKLYSNQIDEAIIKNEIWRIMREFQKCLQDNPASAKKLLNSLKGVQASVASKDDSNSKAD